MFYCRLEQFAPQQLIAMVESDNSDSDLEPLMDILRRVCVESQRVLDAHGFTVKMEWNCRKAAAPPTTEFNTTFESRTLSNYLLTWRRIFRYMRGVSRQTAAWRSPTALGRRRGSCERGSVLAWLNRF